MIPRKNKRFFQWIAGEMQGEVAELESIEEFEGETFYNFTDGESCNLRFIAPMTNNKVDLKQKFMVEVESPMNVWSFDTVKTNLYVDQSMRGEAVEIPTLHDILQANSNSSEVHSDVGTQKLVPPRNEQHLRPLPRIEDYPVKRAPEPAKKPAPTQVNFEVKDNTVQPEEVVETPTQEPVKEEKKVKTEPKKEEIKESHISSNDPVKILVDTCKKHETEISLTISLNLPSRTVYDIASNEFDNGGEKFIHYITNDIDVSDIIKAIENALTESYTSDEKNSDVEFKIDEVEDASDVVN